MFRPSSKPTRYRARCAGRAGLTVLELLIGISIMVMIVGALGALARAVQSSADYSTSRATAVEHARVVLERITRIVSEATANERFPGFIVLADTVGSYRYPDTLVIWHPEAQTLAANPSRLPLDDPNRLPYFDELVVICPNPTAPSQLIEIRSTNTTCLSSTASNWASQIAVFKTSRVLDTNVLSGSGGTLASYPAVTLTGLLRTCAVTGSAGTTRGAVRFEARLRPSESDWSNTSIAWTALPWVQGIFSATTGLRQAWLRIEVQLVPPEEVASNAGTIQPIPFYGSAAVYYQMRKERRS